MSITVFTLITKIAILRIRSAYPAAVPEAPESDMVLCWCSRPARCRADMLQCRSSARCRAARNRNESRQRREQERKRVVVPPSTLPKNVIAVLTRAGEPSGRRRSGGLLFHLVCAQETEREELKVLLDCGDCRREFNWRSPLRFISKKGGKRGVVLLEAEGHGPLVVQWSAGRVREKTRNSHHQTFDCH